ncbi:hypothetical protein pb186bvf_021162 [Paramecium bursaria]
MSHQYKQRSDHKRRTNKQQCEGISRKPKINKKKLMCINNAKQECVTLEEQIINNKQLMSDLIQKLQLQYEDLDLELVEASNVRLMKAVHKYLMETFSMEMN